MHEVEETFRAIMGQVPSCVAVVTATGDRERRGITIGSFTSVSLTPPLISFNVMRDSRMHALIAAARHYAIHVLGEDQVSLSSNFAEPDRTGVQQFAQVPHTLDTDGVPIITGTVAILHCAAHATYEAGDHSILVGRVLHTTDGPCRRPLLYQEGAYRRLGDHIASYVLPF